MASLSVNNLPEGAAFTKRTGTFTQDTVPAGLLADHVTKAGVWGLIKVESGCLLYCSTDPRRDSFEVELRSDVAPGIIEPTMLHHVKLIGPVRFHVEFYHL